MRTLTISVDRRDSFLVAREFMEAAFSSTEYIGETISFPSAELLWKKLSPKRIQIVEAMAGAGEMTMREVARRVGRDFKAVHSDILGLIEVGVVERVENGVIMPFDEIHMDLIKLSAA
ncbi:transcriptional regulator [Salmonella enterica]|nr:transcriptional regulator [Salmonella enterica]